MLQNSDGKRFMFERHPRQLQRADRRQRGGGLALLPGRQERAPPARAAHARPRRALHRARGQGGPRQPARRRVPRHRLDQGEASRTRAEHIKQEAAEHVPPVQGARRHRHHGGADGGRPDDALHHGRRARGRRHADVDGAGPLRRRRVRRGPPRRQPARRQLALRPAGVRQARGRARGRRSPQARPAPARRCARQVEAAPRARALAPFERGAGAARAPTRSSTTCRR